MAKQQNKASITEIFFSIQGEGIFVGMPQVFIRFSGCNIACDYCDTISGQAKEMAPTQIAQKAVTLAKKTGVNVVSITGGEPLLFAPQLKELFLLLKERGLKIYLETNGILWGGLKHIVGEIEYCAMDIKLPSACRREYWAEHNEFLNILAAQMSPGYFFVKIVINAKTEEKEIAKAARVIAKAGREIPLVLQPVTLKKGRIWFDQPRVNRFLKIASEFLKDVRVIPQVHKTIGVR